MSKFVCPKCGRDCGTHLALGKHKKKCAPEKKFVSRFANRDRCPVCSNFGKVFYVKGPMAYICLECGLTFCPNDALEKLKDQVREISWERE